jgi:pyruvate ferredoxin oxidoreductase beta subunit
MRIHGSRYVHVHVPCPLGWGAQPRDTIRVARLSVETGLFPLFEAEFGNVTERTPFRQVKPVEEDLRLQKRFAQPFQPGANPVWITAIQEIANRNVQEFGLTPEVDLG